jgi:hypothetical protein
MSSSGSLVARLVLTGDNKGIVAAAEGTTVALDQTKRKIVETGAAAAGMAAEFNANAIAIKGQTEATVMANAAITAGAETKRADIVALTQQAAAGEAVTNRVRAMAAAQTEYNVTIAQARTLLASATITQLEYTEAVNAASVQLALSRAASNTGTAAMIAEKDAAIAIGAALGGMNIEAETAAMGLGRVEANLAKLGKAGGVPRAIIGRTRAALAAIPEVISAFPLISAAGAATAAVGVLAAAEQSYEASIGGLNVTLQAHSLAVAGTSGEYLKLTGDIAKASNVSIRSAREIEASFADAHVDKSLWNSAAAMSKDYAAVLGISVPEAAQKAAEGMQKPYEWAVQLTQQYGLFDQATLQQIRDLTESGKIMDANKVIIGAMTARFKDATDQTTLWGQALNWTSKAASDFWESIGHHARGFAPEEQRDILQKQLDGALKDNPNGYRTTQIANLRGLIAALDKKIADAGGKAKADKNIEARNTEAVAISGLVNGYTTNPYDQKLRDLNSQKARIEAAYSKGITATDANGNTVSKEKALAAVGAEITKVTKERADAMRALNEVEKQHYEKIKQLIAGSGQAIAQANLETASAVGRTEAYQQGSVALEAFNDQQEIAKASLSYTTELSFAHGKAVQQLTDTIDKLTEAKKNQLIADKALSAMQEADQQIGSASGYMDDALQNARQEALRKKANDHYVRLSKDLAAGKNLAKDKGEPTEGYDAAQAKLDMAFSHSLKEADDEDLRNRRDWASGVIRANQEVLRSYSDFASQSEGFIKGWAQQGEDEFLAFAKSGKLSIGSLASFVEDQFLKMAYQRYLATSVNSIGNSALGFMDSALSGLGSIFGVSAGVHHGGGRAGSAAMMRDVPLALYYAAPRYHTGIDKVIKQGEVPAILQVGERVETAAQANSTDRMIAAYQQLQSRPVVNLLPVQASGSSGTTGNPAPKVEVHNHGEPMQVSQQYDPSSNTMRVDLRRDLGKAVASSIEAGSADKALKRYGASPLLTRRQ